MPVAVAPSPLAPGFPRTWPDCREDMHVMARDLIANGRCDDSVARTLWKAFGEALPRDRWSEEICKRTCRNVVAKERAALRSRRPR